MIQEVTREICKVPGFIGVESPTRNMRLLLHNSVIIGQLSHQLECVRCSVLVLVPGRLLFFLCSRITGYMLKDCQVRRCGIWWRFGHVTEDCVRTYATITVPIEHAFSDFLMDPQEREEAAALYVRPPVPRPLQEVSAERIVLPSLSTVASVKTTKPMAEPR